MNDFSNDTPSFIKGLKSGNEEAYSFLVDFYHQKLCVYAFSLVHDDDFAKDIVQNVFVNVWEKRTRLKDNFNVQNFLYKSVYNKFIDLYRKEKATTALEKKYIEALDKITEDRDNSLDKLVALVKKEINNLPPKCKQIFILSKQEGLTNLEISEHLSVSIKTVEAQITKAFLVIRKNIGNKTDGILFLLFGHIKKYDF